MAFRQFTEKYKRKQRRLVREFFVAAEAAGYGLKDNAGLAELLGVSKETVSNWRRGKHLPTRVESHASINTAMVLWKEEAARMAASTPAPLKLEPVAKAAIAAHRIAAIQYEGGVSVEFPSDGVVEVSVPAGVEVIVRHKAAE